MLKCYDADGLIASAHMEMTGPDGDNQENGNPCRKALQSYVIGIRKRIGIRIRKEQEYVEFGNNKEIANRLV